MRKWIALLIFLFVAVPLLLYTGRYQKPIRVLSPGYATEISFRLDENGRPLYSVLFGKKSVIVDSPMGIEFRQSGLLAQDLERTDFKRRGRDDEYTLVAGKKRRARDRFNEITVSLKESVKPHRRLDIVLRAYDDGVAFRYHIPKQKIFRPAEIIAEWSCFRFIENSRCWFERIDRWDSAFEKPYEQGSLDDIRPEYIVAIPLVIELDDELFVAISEADLSGYGSMRLGGLGGSAHTLVSKLSPLPETNNVCAIAQSPFTTPWRVITMGKSAGDLVESNIVTSLARESMLSDTDWIEPGLVLYPWWSNYKSGGSSNRTMFESLKYYIDFASEKGIPYVEVGPPWYGRESGGTSERDSFDILKPDPKLKFKELLDYAGQRNVKLILWADWKDIGSRMDSVFAEFRAWGASGVTIDFRNRSDQAAIEWLESALDAAARNRLLVSCRGMLLTPGLERTWPNLLSSDAVAGNECNKWDNRASADHNVTIPFTRMLAGAMDFAPGGFDNVRPVDFVPDLSSPKVMTTRCHQLAMFVVYESHLQRICDWPGAYHDEPAFDFIASVPTAWDETKILSGEIGKHIAIARRSEKNWFFGSMTGSSRKTLVVPLSFLGRDRYEAKIFMDGPGVSPDPKDVLIITRLVTGSDSLDIEMAPCGGAAAMFTRKK